MSQIIPLIFTPQGPKVCFKGLSAEEVYKKFEHRDSKYEIIGGSICESRQEITVYVKHK